MSAESNRRSRQRDLTHRERRINTGSYVPVRHVQKAVSRIAGRNLLDAIQAGPGGARKFLSDFGMALGDSFFTRRANKPPADHTHHRSQENARRMAQMARGIIKQ